MSNLVLWSHSPQLNRFASLLTSLKGKIWHSQLAKPSWMASWQAHYRHWADMYGNSSSSTNNYFWLLKWTESILPIHTSNIHVAELALILSLANFKRNIYSSLSVSTRLLNVPVSHSLCLLFVVGQVAYSQFITFFHWEQLHVAAGNLAIGVSHTVNVP